MSRQHISLKARVRYEGRVRIFDRRSVQDTHYEDLPNPIWRMVNKALSSHFHDGAAERKPVAKSDGAA